MASNGDHYDRATKMMTAIVGTLLDNKDAIELLLLAAQALRHDEAIMPDALRLFQCGGKFSQAAVNKTNYGGSIIVGGWQAMVEFCERHEKQFIREQCKEHP